MNRQFAALLWITGSIAALWALGRACDIGEALTRDLIHRLFPDDQEKDQ